MSSSASRGGERTVHQDFIARIRYANTLPPPPNPPKLLDIPNTGLGSGHYTTPGFASRLAREQPLNIEVDAELGMPLDLIGMPGVFDGDESSIQSDPHPPPVHPHDRALLKPLSTLGKPRTSEASVSFLRRTEYISSVGAKNNVPSPLRPSGAAAAAARRAEKRPSPEPDAGTPAYVKRKIDQSFAAAQNAARDRYARVRHPTKKNLKLEAAYPLLPDLGAFPDSGAYVTIKFSNNPVVAGSGVYDTRLLSGVFKPVDQAEEDRLLYDIALKAHERDPLRNPKPHNRMQYEFFMPDNTATGEAFRREFDAEGNEDEEKFNFNRVRAYESIEEKEFNHATKYSEEILLTFAEEAQDIAPDLGARVAGGPRAALYYPVMQRTVVRSHRSKTIGRGGPSQEPNDEEGQGERVVDRLQVSVHDPPEDMKEHIARIRADPLHFQENEMDADGEEEDTPAARHERRHHRAVEDDDEVDDEPRRHHDEDDEEVEDDRRREASSSPAGRTNGHSSRNHSNRISDDDSDNHEVDEDED